jgi:diguanylate cyclase (GGDEF)-like protein/PAS domain S-box-containing protein
MVWTSDVEARHSKRLRFFCEGSAIASVALGSMVLCGWTFRFTPLNSVLQGLVTVKANTALALVLSGISLWLLIPRESSPRRRSIAFVFAFLVGMIGLGTFCEYLFGLNLGIDQLLFHEPAGALATHSPGRMAPIATVAITAIGAALMLLALKTRLSERAAQLLSLLTALAAMLAIIGYIDHATPLYRFMEYTQVALYTAIALFLLSAAVFFARPSSAMAGDLTRVGSGSTMARRFLPAVFLVPVSVGWICLRGERAGFYGTELGLALYTTSNVVVFAFLVWLSSRRLNEESVQRNKAEIEIRELNAQLEWRVAERTKTLEQQATLLAEQAGLLDIAHDSIFVRDMDDRITFWSKGAAEKYGWTADEALGQAAHEFLKTESPIPLEQINAELMSQGRWEGELVHTRADQTRITVASRWALQRDALGDPRVILEINNDITERRLAENLLQQSDEKLRLLFHGVKDYAILMLDPNGLVTTWNEGAERIKGYRAEEIIGQHFSRFYPLESQAEGLPSLGLKIASELGRFEDEGWRIREDGSRFWANVVITALHDAAGNLRGFGKVTRDITERKMAEEALFAEKERAQVTLNSIGDAVICTNTSGNITFLNSVAERMTGWLSQDAFGNPMSEVFRILDATSRDTVANPMDMAIEQDRTMHLPLNCILIRRDGVEIPIEDSVAPIHNREGEPTGAVIVFRDVSAAHAMAEQMEHSAKHDFLTGLPNRMLLNDRISQAIAIAKRHGTQVALLFLDLDGFKHINDSLGHSIGDKLLQSIAKRLVGSVRASDTVSRQGGDEFIVLLFDVNHPEDSDCVARKILNAIAEPHLVDDHELHITASVGVSVYPDDGLDAETLIRNADTAMYQAKEDGTQICRFFEPAMNLRAVQRQSTEESLRRALYRKEFRLEYQPKINLKTGMITGAEALIRWTHPVRGPISPAEFIPIAEDCGLILPIGHWALHEACKQARAWADAGLSQITMAVNISGNEFRGANFLESVVAILKDTGLDPRSLELELTESVLMRHPEAVEPTLKALRAEGVQLAVDDFGTGYSSLSYLSKFSIDALKIDQSFVRQTGTNLREKTIVSAIIGMGRSLNLRVVAEGVETVEELAFLQTQHCEEAQGYFFSRPVPPAEFARLLKKQSPYLDLCVLV